MTDKRSNAMAEFMKKEQELALFNIKIDGIVIYGFLCRDLRKKYLQKKGILLDESGGEKKKKNKLKNKIISFFQLLKLSLLKRSYDNFIYSYYRVDKVGDVFLDKFTDPIIDNSSIKDSYIVFEKSHNFEHKSPRLHRSKLVYTDYIEQKAIRYAKKNKNSYIEQHKEELELLWNKLDKLMEDLPYSKDWTVVRILRDKSMMDFYKSFFLKHKIKRFIAPCRAVFLPHMYVCKELKIPVIELQHGINHGMGSITYLGYTDDHFAPDYFLSFGELRHQEYYGVENCKVVNIGWAMFDYINSIVDTKELKPNSVLVIASNNITSLFKLIGELATDYPEFEFHVRLHPLYSITETAKIIVEEHPNILIQDNTINISVEINKYKMVIGDNSTAIVEALSYGKKVGRINYENMVPKYVYEGEKNVEWEISDRESFYMFVEAGINKTDDLCFYTKYNSEALEKLLCETC